MVRTLDDETIENYRLSGKTPKLSADEVNARRFDEETKKQDKTTRINTLYRIRVAGKEYITYNLTTIATTDLGNQRTKSEEMGTNEVKTWSYKIDPKTEQRIPNDIVGEKVEYTIPFSPQRLQEIVESATAQDSEPRYYVHIPGVGSPFGGFSLEELLTQSFDDLRYKGEHGFYPERPLRNPNSNPEASFATKLAERKKGLLVVPKTEETVTEVEQEEVVAPEPVSKPVFQPQTRKKRQQQSASSVTPAFRQQQQQQQQQSQSKSPQEIVNSIKKDIDTANESEDNNTSNNTNTVEE